ncbi:short-chain dehydrogenase [Dactylonectria estremocensis]|uniref:Short-chain dehydrogenase n=1 Tax=Dactylonectria estremocensis TaxID=1079267 RepID=A0A9P9EG07_9HYPO|nr:short-chain dehydrogenase [Dactylonectria estremocensis]
MSSAQTILITGANRGIGHGIASALLQKPSTTVIAAVRDPSKESSVALANLPKGTDSRLIIVKLDVTIESDPVAAVETLKNEHNLQSLDVVIANAGISHSGTSVLQSSSSAIADHFAINTTGPIILLQATAPLLKASKNPTFIAISSMMGSIGGMELLAGIPAIMSPYGGSKGALNWFLRRVHFEEPWLTTIAVHPGLVLTDMAKVMFGKLGVDPKDFGAISVEESVKGLVERVATANREVSGTFQNYDGNPLPW